MQAYTIYFKYNFKIKYMYFIKYFRIFIQLYQCYYYFKSEDCCYRQVKTVLYIIFLHYTKSKF